VRSRLGSLESFYFGPRALAVGVAHLILVRRTMSLEVTMSRRVWSSFVAAILFWTFFAMTKHLRFFAPFSPFDKDPYDILSSFTFQIAVAVGGLNLLRLYLNRRHGLTESFTYLSRGVAVIALCVLGTMVSDAVAILRSGLHRPRGPSEFVLWLAMVVLALISVFLLKGLPNRHIVPSSLASTSSEFGRLFQRLGLCAIDPYRHGVRFALVVALAMGFMTTASELVCDGPAPTLRQTILVVGIRITIEASVVFIGLLSLGAYLGLLVVSSRQLSRPLHKSGSVP